MKDKDFLFKANLEAAHKKSSQHRIGILESNLCGCFHCLGIYPPAEIKEWVDTDQTAICPRCNIDSVLGDKLLVPSLTRDFLKVMHLYYFDRTHKLGAKQ